jgi:hypothetical protein
LLAWRDMSQKTLGLPYWLPFEDPVGGAGPYALGREVRVLFPSRLAACGAKGWGHHTADLDSTAVARTTCAGSTWKENLWPQMAAGTAPARSSASLARVRPGHSSRRPARSPIRRPHSPVAEPWRGAPNKRIRSSCSRCEDIGENSSGSGWRKQWRAPHGGGRGRRPHYPIYYSGFVGANPFAAPGCGPGFRAWRLAVWIAIRPDNNRQGRSIEL